MTKITIANKETVTHEKITKWKDSILEVLNRAADDYSFMAFLSEDPFRALADYNGLTSEEKAAIASGDINKIESWIGKLNSHQATWLINRMSQENW